MRTVLGLTAAALALGSFAMPAHAGCLDDYLSGDDSRAPQQGTVTFNPDGSVTVQPNALVPDATNYANYGVGIAVGEANRAIAFVNCVK